MEAEICQFYKFGSRNYKDNCQRKHWRKQLQKHKLFFKTTVSNDRLYQHHSSHCIIPKKKYSSGSFSTLTAIYQGGGLVITSFYQMSVMATLSCQNKCADYCWLLWHTMCWRLLTTLTHNVLTTADYSGTQSADYYWLLWHTLYWLLLITLAHNVLATDDYSSTQCDDYCWLL